MKRGKLVTTLFGCLDPFMPSIHSEEGAKYVPPKYAIWHVDYFELKAIKTQQTQEKLLPSPLTNYLKEFRQKAWPRKKTINQK